MSIDPELQAKIDALEDERLKAEIIDVLTGPGKKRASDEAIYETMISGYEMATQQQARLRKWREDEVAAFSAYFKERKPEDYAEFLRQEHEFNEIESGLAWGVRQLILEWMPGLDLRDCSGLFSKFRDYSKSQAAASNAIDDREPTSASRQL
ncbi:hypothetical protein [Lysobacter enzymogenes]|uniref:hypothetical protein n=1 Tax=Lysobacter enzymogenes TaxID=69 RepID=UPI00089B2A36|nr:hypothetical protein [Lysobacter enzymogenes]SDX95934.1 hypothetical protein SAMN05421681_109169 [Lysobacter enzymogenes]